MDYAFGYSAGGCGGGASNRFLQGKEMEHTL